VVNPNQPSIVTTQDPASGAIGDTYKDKATLSNTANLDGTGKITWTLYPKNDCSGTALGTDQVTGVSGNGPFETPNGVTVQNAGTYYWVASFSGDSNNKSATSGCADEPVVVNPNQPKIATTQDPASGAIGDTYKDKATLSNTANLDGTGTITWTLYPKSDCSGTALGTDKVTGISGNGPFETPNGVVVNNAGTYYWVASFSGDSNNKSATSGCADEPVVVSPNQPKIATTQDPASGAIGDTYKDKATLSNTANLDGTGSITWTLYPKSDCSGDPLGTDKVTGVNGNGPFETPNGVVVTNAGTYYWVASFSGDSNNASATSGCADEPVVVNPNQPSIVTTQDPASGAIGDTYKDKATLSNTANLDGTGSITWTLYPKSDCSGDPLGTDKVSDVGSNGPFETPTGVTVQNAGTYYWVASFSGDSNNKSATSGCADEPVVVNPNQPKIVTNQDPASGSVGDTFKDSATLSGSVNQSGQGTITWKLYSNNECSGDPLDTESVSVDDNGTFATPNGVVLNKAGTYYWVASFSGDDNNLPASSGCADEPVVVKPAAIQIVKTADKAQVNAGEPIGFTLTVSNSGDGDAHGVKLTDTLPNEPGLSWTVENTGAGWGSPCTIDAGVLSCGGQNGVTVPGGTTQEESTFTVHITSPTTAATGGVCPEGSGVINNTGHVSTSNDGSGDSTASTCVAAPAIHIVKTADKADVNVGDPIGFTLTVSNSGSGDAHGVKLTDTLPTNPGLSWTVDKTGAGWGSPCTISAGVLSCGGANGVTVPAGTTQSASTFTVHITSTTTPATAGDCPETGVVNNTGKVTTSNDGSDQSSASTCVQALVDLSITKAGSPATQQLGAGNITWTIVVTNNGPNADTGVKITDPMPAGNTFVSATSTQGTCAGGAILSCDIGDMAANAKVTITLITTPSTAGTQTNTVAVSGNRPETNTGNNQATATVEVTNAPFVPPCIAVTRVTPKQLFVGRKTTVTIHVTQQGKARKGIHVRIKGPKINVKTKASNVKGVIKHSIKMKKAGVLIFTPIPPRGTASCNTKRVGVTNVFTPPVTG
jgi:uncharacterized repeat protein (TIGR01451 family)